MDDYIQIGPDVLFAAAVLNPEWGSQYQSASAPASADRGARTASPDAQADRQGEHVLRERDAQMALL